MPEPPSLRAAWAVPTALQLGTLELTRERGRSPAAKEERKRETLMMKTKTDRTTGDYLKMEQLLYLAVIFCPPSVAYSATK